MFNSAEKENTFRSLKEQPLLATSFWCKIGWHRWTKYDSIVNENYGLWQYLSQYRECVCCGKNDRNVIHKY